MIHLTLEYSNNRIWRVARLKLRCEGMIEDFCLGSPLVGFQGSAEDQLKVCSW